VTSAPRTKLRASRTIATTPSDSSNSSRDYASLASATTPCAESAAFFVSSAVTGIEHGQCKSSNQQLLMWGRYPHIDTSPHTPMGTETGIPLMHQLIDPLCKEFAGSLLELHITTAFISMTKAMDH
jgi:hypothetical protein